MSRFLGKNYQKIVFVARSINAGKIDLIRAQLCRALAPKKNIHNKVLKMSNLARPVEKALLSSNDSMMKWALRELICSLPKSRDWLNPDAEKILREVLAATPALSAEKERQLGARREDVLGNAAERSRAINDSALPSDEKVQRLTGEAVVKILEQDCINDYGARLLLNGDEMLFDLPELTKLCNAAILAASGGAPAPLPE